MVHGRPVVHKTSRTASENGWNIASGKKITAAGEAAAFFLPTYSLEWREILLLLLPVRKLLIFGAHPSAHARLKALGAAAVAGAG